MEETLEKVNPSSEEKLSNEGGIRLRLRDRDLLKRRKAEAEEKATNQWVYGAQSLKRAKKRPSGATGRKGRPRKQQPIAAAEDVCVSAEADPVSLPIPAPVLPPAAETETPQPDPQSLPVETLSEKPPQTFLIEDLGPDEEEDLPSPQKRLVIDTGEEEQQRVDPPELSQTPTAAFPPASAASYIETFPEPLI